MRVGDDDDDDDLSEQSGVNANGGRREVGIGIGWGIEAVMYADISGRAVLLPVSYTYLAYLPLSHILYSLCFYRCWRSGSTGVMDSSVHWERGRWQSEYRWRSVRCGDDGVPACRSYTTDYSTDGGGGGS